VIVFDTSLIVPWVCERVGIQKWSLDSFTAIGRLKDGKLVAGVLYEDCNGANVFCHIAGEGSGWMNRQFLSIIFDYPFRQLGVKRISGVVEASNAAARKLDEHLGFELEAILHDAHPKGDLYIYKMTADQCRWLKDLPYERYALARNS
jgi:RimJ/RimL family protein N-acetyltransferase